MRNIRKNGKVTALAIAVLFALNITAGMPMSVSALGTETYVHSGYTVTYEVPNAWTGFQTVMVTIQNTGSEAIRNWAVGYDAGGEVTSLWNAAIYGQEGTRHILKNAGYNADIAPGASVNFGYTLAADNPEVPDDIIIVTKRVDITSGYVVYFNMTGDFGNSFNGEVTISNTSNADISGWQLTFEGNIALTDVWNADLLSDNNGQITVAGGLNANTVAAGGSVTFGIAGGKEVNETVSLENYLLTGTVIPLTFLYEEDEEIDWDDPTDTDDDGIPDIYEVNVYGTDPLDPDTDGDGLPDGYEVYILGTDPLKKDTDDNSVWDGNEDFDD
ncbi:MAG: cellulose binding domain-containing protein, partial [Oscillospiraceae bacterium]|nr:cellulose binding domain-containing protein [Oscillospiraceae bacterium]